MRSAEFDKVVSMFAELVAYYGNETNGQYLERVLRAEKMLKLVDHQELKKHQEAAKKASE